MAAGCLNCGKQYVECDCPDDGTKPLDLADFLSAARPPERPTIRYFGGKWVLAPWIISNFPNHRVYVEPFGGGASVLMRKARSYAEVYNDLDGEIVSLFKVLRDQKTCRQLERALRLTPFSREEFWLAYEPASDPVEAARRLLVRAYMGFGSDGHNTAAGRTGFRASSNRSGTTPAHDWVNFPDELRHFCARLAGVVIENRDAKACMAQQDSSQTLHFVDPPYVHSTRGDIRHGYNCEMSDQEHAELCDFLKTLQGMVILCGYENEIYDSLGWRTIRREALADGARKRTEILWVNDAVWESQDQKSFDI